MPSRWLSGFTIIAFFVGIANAQSPRRHWHETPDETIWTGRYGNCDHGYFVLLPRSVVGHDTLPPSPNHGFEIDPAAPGT